MLELLHIENIAVIESADIRFRPGFNALTGETGAGKSIVIDAMNAVLGGRTSRELIRTGADKAFVSALFTAVPPELPGLADAGVTPDENGELLLQREVGADGRNLCRANGRPLSVAQLKTLGRNLLNIHGQHDGQQLLDEEMHGWYLDRYGRTDRELTAYQEAWTHLSELRASIRALEMDESEKARRIDSLRFQIDELERAELKEGEDEALTERRNLLRSGEKYIGALSRADGALSGGEYGGALEAVDEAIGALHSIRSLSCDIAALVERLEGARSELMDVAALVRDKREEFDFSPAELDAVESRSDQLYRLKKKYGATVEEMMAYLARCLAQLDEIQTSDDRLQHLRAKEKKAAEAVRARGAELTSVRTERAKTLEEAIARELRDLDMKKVRFAIEITAKDPGPDGCDQIRFLMSANVGEELRPIAKIASGGELARIMLALKNVLSSQEDIGTMVFDEVDTGVSGRAAQRVAEKLAQVSRQKQVLCVTHLPQLAAMADTHFCVEKGERNGRTYTRVTELDDEGRARELGRITGGDRLTPAQLSGARELLAQAAAYRNSIR